MAEFNLCEGNDELHWKWTDSRKFTVRSAYLAMFEGRTEFEGHDLIWTSKAPTKCKKILWLACRKRCWTADRLQRRGMDHPRA